MKAADKKFDVQEIRAHFPILGTKVGKYDLVYFDNAATTQKPVSVIETLDEYYRTYNANIHRGAHFMADKGTTAFENSRKKIQEFIGAESPEQVIFTKGTTEGINLIASGLSKGFLKKGDEILVTGMEHHANIVPWQMACEQTGAVLRVVPVLENGELDLDAFEKLLGKKTRVLSFVYVSNALGIINPAEYMLRKAAEYDLITILDCAQAVGHFRIDVQKLTCDFAVFSGHKMYGPTGIGILYGKKERLEALPPYQGGGEMIKEVSFEKTTYNELPFKFEAGTPNIADGIALGTAVDFIMGLDAVAVAAHEHDLLGRATEIIENVPGINILGKAANKASVVSFTAENAHPSDIGTLLDQFGIAVRTGHHCCQPLMKRFEIPGTVRVSLSLYNTHEELEFFAQALSRVMGMLG